MLAEHNRRFFSHISRKIGKTYLFCWSIVDIISRCRHFFGPEFTQIRNRVGIVCTLEMKTYLIHTNTPTHRNIFTLNSISFWWSWSVRESRSQMSISWRPSIPHNRHSENKFTIWIFSISKNKERSVEDETWMAANCVDTNNGYVSGWVNGWVVNVNCKAALQRIRMRSIRIHPQRLTCGFKSRTNDNVVENSMPEFNTIYHG